MIALFDVGGPELILILLAALMLFGAKRLPELARGLGRSVEEFKRAATNVKQEIMHAQAELEEPPAPPPELPAPPADPYKEPDYASVDIGISGDVPASGEMSAESSTPTESGVPEEPSAGSSPDAAAADVSNPEATPVLPTTPPEGTVSQNESEHAPVPPKSE